jgi:GTP-binding protein
MFSSKILKASIESRSRCFDASLEAIKREINHRKENFKSKIKSYEVELLLNYETRRDIVMQKDVSRGVYLFDKAKIFIQAGDGGDGCAAFRYGKTSEFERAIPNGGNGGNGGNIWAAADPSIKSLLCYQKRKTFHAKPGRNGLGKNKSGSNGGDIILQVPCGTEIRKINTCSIAPVAELLGKGEQILLLPGGRGGKGNASMNREWNKATTTAEKGEKGTAMWLELELKIIADLGIVGVPNSGKSTLLSLLSSVKPKIANYPFTTLVPNLGILGVGERAIVLADIPGLLQGAHLGKGLGQKFLTHCARCRVLIKVIDGSSKDFLNEYTTINLELELASVELSNRPQVIVHNKMDKKDSVRGYIYRSKIFYKDGYKSPIPISAISGRGTLDLIYNVRNALNGLNNTLKSSTPTASQFKPNNQMEIIDEYFIEPPTKGCPHRCFNVTGNGIEKFTQLTRFESYQSVKRLQNVLELSGVFDSLEKVGVRDGDTISIGGIKMEWKGEIRLTKLNLKRPYKLE